MTLLAAILVLGATTTPIQSDPLCGAYCLHVSLRSLDVPVTSLDDLLRRLGDRPPEGYSMAQLSDAARSYGVETLRVISDIESLRRQKGRFACITRLGDRHFVCLYGINGDNVDVVDAPRMYRLPVDVLKTAWKGECLLLSPDKLSLPADTGLSIAMKAVIGAAIAGTGILAANRFRRNATR